MKRLFLFFVLPLLFGAGCRNAQQVKLPAVPDIRIVSPANGAVLTADHVTITGTTNMPSVLINGVAYDATKGVFSTNVHLTEGANTFEMESGNGFTTTSLMLAVTYAPSSSASSTR